ncbi:MAG: 50S ribosomal protein L30 [Candidatus Hadarchaeales archaeon]
MKVPKLAVIRIRGGVGAKADALDTLRLLGLTRVNHCVLVDGTPSILGMLQKVKDYVTWGEIDAEMLELLIRKRGRVEGNRRMTDDVAKKMVGLSISEMAPSICEGKIDLSAIRGLKKVFRLHPPRKGFKALRRPYRDLGDLGYRGREINDLLRRMV